ncbi:unnamed protein product [Musa hybrid cultivar]
MSSSKRDAALALVLPRSWLVMVAQGLVGGVSRRGAFIPGPVHCRGRRCGRIQSVPARPRQVAWNVLGVGAGDLGAVQEPGARLRRALVGQPWNAVLSHVQHLLLDQAGAAGRHRREVVVGEREVRQVAVLSQLAHHVRHLPVEQIPRQVELFHLLQAPQGEGDGAGDLVGPGVEHRGPLQQPCFVGEAAGEPVAEEQDLDQGVAGLADGAGDGAGEVVVGEGEVGGGGAAEVGRDVLGEPVVVEEEHIGADEEDGGWDGAGVAVVAEVEEGEVHEWEHAGGEAAGEAVVAKVELVEEGEVGEGGDGAAEAVGVGVEERKVGKLVDEAADGRGGEGESVEVNGGDGARVAKPRRGLAVEALVAAAVVVADAEPRPGAGLVLGVAGDGLLEALDDEVRAVLQDVLEVARLRLPRRRRRALGLRCRRCSATTDTDADADADLEGFSVAATAAAYGGNEQYRQEY